MKQIIQHLNSGETSLVEVPMPAVQEGHLLIRSVASLVSAGTERMLVDFGRANWINKARQQPERVKAVWDKVKTDGLVPTVEAVRSKLNQPIPLGYSNAGVVLEVGAHVHGFKVGDRVVSNGPHAEIVAVPQHLCARIPDTVSDESAAFTVVSAVALQGIRLVQPTFAETVAVIGLGLIGQVAVQLLLANGCKVIGIDTDASRCALAEQSGAVTYCNIPGEDTASFVWAETKQAGADAVLVTASAKDNHIIGDAAHMCRKRGRIVLVGVVGLQLHRSDFYEKELSFQVSCSYGPGRYDYDYEKNSADYPEAFVRWTAQRNFEAVLQAMANGRLDVRRLVTNRLSLADYKQVYDQEADPNSLATLFTYDRAADRQRTLVLRPVHNEAGGAVAVIGAGNFASKVIVPMLFKNNVPVRMVASANGLSASQLARQYNIPMAGTELDVIWQDKAIHTVVIATQHHTHAALCIRAMQSGKRVFVEKPLAIHAEQLEELKAIYLQQGGTVDVGFNRRHAPLALKMKQLLSKASSLLNVVITVNAGLLPVNNWLGDREKSGGRIIGEVCHFIDLASFLCDGAVASVCTNAQQQDEENVSILLRYTNGCSATIHYFNNGSKAYDKERVEVYGAGKTLVLENWKRLSGFGFAGFSSKSTVQDKGHRSQFGLLAERITKGTAALIPFESLYNTSAAAIAAVQSLKEQKWVNVPAMQN